MNIEIIGKITNIETIAVGNLIREIARLRKVYGIARWRKQKGTASVRLSHGTICKAEVHWYEAHGIGKKEIKMGLRVIEWVHLYLLEHTSKDFQTEILLIS